MADHVKVLQEWLRQVQGRLDYHAGRSPHGPNPSTVAERDALIAAISALTLDEDAVERACEATWPVARFSTEAMTDWARAGTLRQIQHRKVIRAALQAAIHGESQ